jgi:hypothetical protein
MSVTKTIIILATLLLVSIAPLCAAWPVFQKQFGNREVDIELDTYYSNIDFYQSLTHKPIPCLAENSELNIYRHLLFSPVPRYLVVEFSVNPMPWLGVYVRKNEADLYNRTNVTDKLNLVHAVCAGFEEPYAGSVFLGNVVSFQPKGAVGCEGKGYIGVLVSGGNYHIKDSELIEDNWIEGEIKFKGDRTTPINKMIWSCRLGVKYHGNPYIKDVYYVALRRDRIDFTDNRFSLLTNSGIEYTFDMERDSGKIIRHFFRIGKKFPVPWYKCVLSVNMGFVWEGADKYTGPLERTRGAGDLQFLLQPNLEF